MRFEFNLNWAWVLQKARLVFLLGLFYVLYKYTEPVFAFIWLFYFLLNDLYEVIDELEKMKEERSRLWTSISNKRRDF